MASQNCYDKFETAVRLLVKSDRFYASMVQQCRRVFDDKIPTMGVSLSTSVTLHVGTGFVEEKTVEFLAHVLRHEMQHLLTGHLTRVKKYPDYKLNHAFYNQCLDLAVNSAIGFPDSDGPHQFMTINNMARAGYTLQPGQPAEYYIASLREHAEKMPSVGDLADDHSKFGEDGEGEDIPDSVKDQALRHAIKQAHLASAGSVPGHLQALVNEILNRVSPNNWRRELARFPTDCEVVDSESTRSRRNRRYGLLYPGKKPIRKVHLGLGFDVSGSMWDPTVMSALQSEVNKILESGSELTVIYFDSEIKSVYKVTEKLDLNGAHKTEGGGGTCFQPVFDKAKELGLDGLIMATDGCADLKLSYNKPCIWAIYEKQQAESFKAVAPFGKVVHIEAARGS